LEFIDKKLIKLNELKMLILDEGDKLFENRNKKLTDFLAQVLTQKEEDHFKTIFLVFSATYTAKLLK
jgi:superfamily II DNA/RNA helicase